MKIFIFALFLVTSSQAFAAWGVSEKSVKNWDDEKLCVEWGKHASRSSKAADIINDELARRPKIDTLLCMELRAEGIGVRRPGDFWDQAKEPDLDLVSGRHPKMLQLEELRKAGLREFGSEIYRDALLDICGRKDPNPKLTKAYQDLMLNEASKKGLDVGELAANELDAHMRGFGLSLVLAAKIAPEICTESGIENLEKLIRRYVFLAAAKKTSHKIDLVFEIGQSKEEIETAIGKPAYAEKLGPIESQHFCQTDTAPRFLVLYFFKDNLLFQHRYALEGEEPQYVDCTEQVGKPPYEIPEAIKAITG